MDPSSKNSLFKHYYLMRVAVMNALTVDLEKTFLEFHNYLEQLQIPSTQRDPRLFISTDLCLLPIAMEDKCQVVLRDNVVSVPTVLTPGYAFVLEEKSFYSAPPKLTFPAVSWEQFPHVVWAKYVAGKMEAYFVGLVESWKHIKKIKPGTNIASRGNLGCHGKVLDMANSRLTYMEDAVHQIFENLPLSCAHIGPQHLRRCCKVFCVICQKDMCSTCSGYHMHDVVSYRDVENVLFICLNCKRRFVNTRVGMGSYIYDPEDEISLVELAEAKVKLEMQGVVF